MCPSGRRFHLNAAAQSPEIRTAFRVLDTDNDGRISGDDLRAFFSRFPAASDDIISSMISAADVNRSGFVEFEEFERVIFAGGDGIMEDAFRLMDLDGDGKVGFGDLKSYLMSAGMPADDEDVREMICSGGCDESVGVGFEDFLRILAVDSGNKAC
ncbi:putative calcium-binding protein CML19 [Platanthera guangdongensis]|uniref:Calcium-binding protein CML19 n=1 Tax=Platanthera guangdongensis TaxID=2320717 RepID=A0ABR2LRT2_9ASPA